MEFLMNLENILKQRKKELPQGSYTAWLFQEGEDRILKKNYRRSRRSVVSD
jgi:phosphoribosyl-ATP pyrophosphohydrolase